MARKRKGAADDAVEFEFEEGIAGDEWVEDVAPPPADAAGDLVGAVAARVTMRALRVVHLESGAYVPPGAEFAADEAEALDLFRAGRAVPLDGRWP